MKIVQGIKKIVTGVLVVAFYCFAITMTILLLYHNKYGVTQFDNTSLILVNDEMSSEKYTKGDLVVVESKRLDKINVGDELFVYKLDKSGSVSIDVGIIGEVHPDDDAISFKNGSTYGMEFVIGKASGVHDNLGTYLSIVESTLGFLFIVLIPSFLIFMYQLYALIVEIKYGKEVEPSRSPQPSVVEQN